MKICAMLSGKEGKLKLSLTLKQGETDVEHSRNWLESR